MAYGKYKPRGFGRKIRGKRIGAPRRRLYGRRGVRGRIIRAMNPTPTFVETIRKSSDDIVVPAGAGVGAVFKVRINDIPQALQYSDLYTQYRINWVKVMLLPNFDGASADVNMAAYLNSTAGYGGWQGQARIVSAVQDSPNVTVPATEAEVLQDNGCKIRTMKTMWSQSFKPVPDVRQLVSTSPGTGTIAMKSRYREWFNFDTVTTGNNPEHGSVAAFVTLPGVTATPANPSMVSDVARYNCYYKISFSLRDPK